jgi:outer membrane receptor protein involved in Fe transport
MLKNSLLASSTLCSAASLSLLLLASPAMAQTTPAAAQPAAATDAQPADAAPDVVVTGSRIRRPSLDSPVPVTTIQGEEFFHTASTSVGDVLNDLPALTSTFSQSNSTRFLGTAGLSLLDLRGLGTERTLVLVNGRRHVAGDILNEASSVDVNTIPADLIERVDVVTGGDSAVYGSDAIAGVVNFVLKDHYNGVQVRGQSGISQYGDAPNSFISVLAGKNFADGRGNIALNLEYAHQGDLYADDRASYRTTSGFVQVRGVGTATAANPERIFVNDIRSSSYSNGGTFLACANPQCSGYYNAYHFDPSGSLVPTTGTRIGIAPFGSFLGGNGDNFRDGTQLGIMPTQNRYSANLIAHFEISPAFEPFVEAKFVRTDVLGSASGPFFFNGGVTGDARETFYTDNPYLSTQARTFLTNYYGVGPNAHQNFYFNENATSLTNRQEAIRRDTYRIVGGVRGKFGDGWSYEVSGNYGEFRERNEIRGNVNVQRFLLAIDAVDQGKFTTGVANGNIVCRATVDPAARVAYTAGGGDPAFAQSQLAADVAACKPVNLFGAGNVSDAAKGYLLQNSVANGRITQFVLNAFVTGDTGKWFSLPGGPIGLSVGAEYRRETAAYSEDVFTKNALTFYNAIPDFVAPSFEVKEAFGEIRLPILKDVPFFHELTLSGAVRYADYKGATGSVFAYNGNLEWAPFRDLKFRANYSRAVRAPNLVDLYSPLGQNFSLVVDPCSAEAITPGLVTTNCRADGVPVGFSHPYINSLGFLSGGNTQLKAETSDSYTLGFVLQPHWVPGLSLTVDWFDINVDGAIAALSAQSVLNACYSQPTINNQYCALFSRNNTAVAGARGEAPGQILEGSLQVVPLNYAKLRVRGIDAELAYSHSLGSFGNLSTRFIYTHNFRNDSFLSATNANFRTQSLGTLGFPYDEFTWNVGLNKGPFTLDYKLRFIGKQFVAPYGATHTINGIAPTNPFYSDITYYPDVFLHDVRFQIEVTKKYNFYIGVDNLFDKLPPLGTTGAGFGSAIYDNVGRSFYAGFVAKF